MWRFPVIDYANKQVVQFRTDNIFEGMYLEAFEKFIYYYSPVMIVRHPTKKPKLKPKDERTCRFCQRSHPDVSFRKDAHVIPHFMGNHKLIHDEECDECNGIFSKYETSLADFTGVFRTADKIRGKNGIPKFGDQNRGITIQLDKDEENRDILSITGHSLDRMQYKEDEKSYIINVAKTTYIPLYVMKALYKIAYTVLPKDLLADYSPTYQIFNTNKNDGKQIDFCKLFVTTLPQRIVDTPFMLIYNKNKEHIDKPIPSTMVILQFGRFIYQYILPSVNDLVFLTQGQKCQVFFSPPYWKVGDDTPVLKLLDLWSILPKKDDIEHLKFTFTSDPLFVPKSQTE